MKLGRNALCSCGSKKKYKRCCGDPLRTAKEKAAEVDAAMRLMLTQHRAREHIRRQQQGSGRAIISFENGGNRAVVIGDKILSSKKWRTFTDFLSYYIKSVLGGEWAAAEFQKSMADRHPILQWSHDYGEFQRRHLTKEAGLYTAVATGVVHCYLGLAYNLFLLAHNAKLQQRFIERLRNVKQFQGAYYELIVANCLIRAGFVLELEDEQDEASKHCEFAAVSKASGKKYWIEAKMRGVKNLLGKTGVDGTTRTDPTSNLTEHLNKALEKPAPDQRIIFIDLNCPSTGASEPKWLAKAIQRLDAREKASSDTDAAYVFVTNMCHHHHLDTVPEIEALAYGFKIPDFSKPESIRLPEMYRRRQRHGDAHRVFESLRNYPKIPSTFDGNLPSTAFYGERAPVRIGQTYFFEDVKGGIVAKVTAATVSESEKLAIICVSTVDGRSFILNEPMSDRQLSEYREHRDAYFGEVRRASRETKTEYELFEFLVDAHKETPREKFLEWFKGAADFEELSQLSRDELMLTYCERNVIAVVLGKQTKEQKPLGD